MPLVRQSLNHISLDNHLLRPSRYPVKSARKPCELNLLLISLLCDCLDGLVNCDVLLMS